MKWRCNRKIKSFTESVVLVYFEELSKVVKPSTLWSQYSMLRGTLNIKHNVNLSEFHKLRALLKRKSEKYTPKKSKTLTSENIHQFLLNAPDEKYLLIKVKYLVMCCYNISCFKRLFRSVLLLELAAPVVETNYAN